MSKEPEPNSKAGNKAGSGLQTAPSDGGRKPDGSSDREANDEGADPIPDIRKQNPGEKTSADLATELTRHDPQDVEKSK